MGLLSVLDISSAGLDVQRSRLEVTAANLANSQTSSSSAATAYQPLTVVVHAHLPGADAAGSAENALPRPEVAGFAPLNAAPRRSYQPGHPDADAQGFVTYPGVDPVANMLDLMSIMRSYEANLKAFDITRSLLQRTLDLGGGR
jgi:flagellar basal-body rod protein FlgC